mgnify:CR=1 FL=1
MLQLIDYGESAIFIVLLFASILSFAVILERAIVFRRDTSKRTAEFKSALVESIRTGDMKGAMETAVHHTTSSYGRFAEFALVLCENNHMGLQDLMEGKIIEEKLILEKHLTILNTGN